MAVSDACIIAKLVDKTVFVVQWDIPPYSHQGGCTAVKKWRHRYCRLCILNQVDLQRYASSLSYSGSGYYYQHARYGDYYTN